MSDLPRDRRHAQSFRENAGGYDAHRPGYPRESVQWLLGDAHDVADIGAGTGKLTRELVELGANVTAIDPAPEMLHVLGERLPQLTRLEGAAENLPLPDASMDLITFAQAWHWVDVDAATREALRVLRPKGRLGLIWNTRDESVPWVDALSAAMHRGLHEASAYEPQLGSGLELVGQREQRWNARTDREGILALATTRSYYLTATPAERRVMIARIEGVLDAFPETSGSEILLPYVTQAWIAERWTPGC
ncbi:class I SAM-dependent methyltransferase [Rathayibacter sp. YIM 133350]|uniref:class I SAM-dependent methyltransferase n=1 Tax=Rathayibacter sp. YIM 133350 TaxID=3131992 RepID=UPI00307D8C23